MRTAKAWGLTPDQWFEESSQSRHLMMAYEETTAEIQASVDYKTEKKRKQQQRK